MRTSEVFLALWWVLPSDEQASTDMDICKQCPFFSILGFAVGPILAPIRTDVDATCSKRFAGIYHVKAAHCKFWRALASRFSFFLVRMQNLTKDPIW
jgi:hypothetical protein